MIETREFDLQWDGRRCQVDQLGAKAARAVTVRLGNIIGTALREVGTGGGSVANLDLSAAGAVLERLDAVTAEALTDTFLKVTRIEADPGTEEWVDAAKVQDLVFGGGDGLERWRRWLVFCVEMSCGAFFRGALVEAEARTRAAAKRNPSPTTSSSPTSSIGSPRAESTPTA